MDRWIFLALGFGLLSFQSTAAQELFDSHSDASFLEASGVSCRPNDLLQFFFNRTLHPGDGPRLQQLIQQLGDDNFVVREQATTRLIGMGPRALSSLQIACENRDPEVARRAESCCELLLQQLNPRLVCAAIRQLASVSDERVVDVLLAFAGSTDQPLELQEIARVLSHLGIRNGMAHPHLLEAIHDSRSARRQVAGQALAGLASAHSAVSKLLEDSDRSVRCHVALAMVRSRHRQAIPVLIDLLADLSDEERYPVEEVLYQLADGKGPAYLADVEEDHRNRRRDGWLTWWQDHGNNIDLDRLTRPQPFLGNTLMIHYGTANRGSVQEVDRDGNRLWHISGLSYPVDAQVLAGERVLITEFRSRQVTERDFKGNILWTYTAPTLVRGARRSVNGNTFLVLADRLVEIDRQGKELWKYNPGIGVACATRLPNGGCILGTITGQLQYLDASGRIRKTVNLPGNLYPLGAILDVSTNGSVLLSLYNQDQVIELDSEGKKIWEASVSRPMSAIRLPGGNILVASRSEMAAIEINREGKEVNQVSASGFLIRASRR